MSTLQTISSELAAIVTASAPHIVRIEGRKRLGATGVVLGDGVIATAHHVVRTDGPITIGLESGETASAEMIGRDPSTDLAFLKTDADLAKMPFSATVDPVGSIVLALGRPGRTVQATFGIISAVGGEWRTGMGGVIDQYVQTDVIMYPGFSGGPLVNTAGEMVGLNTSGLMRGVSLAIPFSTVQNAAAAIVEHGHIRRGYLGVSTQIVRLPRAFREQLSQKAGLLVVGVESSSPADEAGVVMGDTLVAVANQSIGNHHDLLAQLSAERIGEKTPFTIIRGGELQSLNVVIGERD
ncbi:MAG: S1C family serine protease [Anaerolineae bacterium]|nr:S1C family serine protease [Anaerolineae bacterium]